MTEFAARAGWPGRRDYLVFWLSGLVAATTAGALLLIEPDAFEQYLGPINPILVVVVAAVAGGGSLRLLEARAWWSAGASSEVRRGILLSTSAALAFASVAIAIDIWLGFPPDLNVGWPRSLLFYPAIAFVAEVGFHILPLALLTILTRWRFTRPGRVWAGVLAVASLEAAFQVSLGSGLDVFVGVHLFAIGVYELLVFRRFGYIPMIWFRLAYYIIWHVLWGHVRLDLLF